MPRDSKTIVGVTPLPADRDSRACRIAASCARLGYRSVLVEALPSQPGFTIDGVELVSMRRGRPGRWLGPARIPVRFLTDCVVRPATRVRRADLVYLHAFYQYPGIALRRRFSPVPIVYDAHDFYSTLVSRAAEPRLQRSIEDRVERDLVRHAAAVVTVSDGVASLYEDRFGVRPEVLRNSHDDRLDEPVPQTIRATIGAAPSDTVVVMIGQWKRETPVLGLLDALALTDRSVRLAFLGSGFEPSLVDEARRRGVADRVSFLPAVPPSHVVPFVADADAAGVLYRPSNPSVQQCLPNGLFQALASGLPVVFAQDLPMVAAEVDGAGVAVDADDPTAMARAFDRLALDPSMRAAMSECATARARDVAWLHEERRLGVILERALGTAGDG